MVLYNEIYNRNKKLDDIFMNKYFNVESKYYEKNCLELIVELCEYQKVELKFIELDATIMYAGMVVLLG